MRSIKFIQNYHNEHTKLNFGSYAHCGNFVYTSHFAVYELLDLTRAGHTNNERKLNLPLKLIIEDVS